MMGTKGDFEMNKASSGEKKKTDDCHIRNALFFNSGRSVGHTRRLVVVALKPTETERSSWSMEYFEDQRPNGQGGP